MLVEENIYHQDQIFEKIAVLNKGSRATQFDSCTFKNCDLTGADFSGCDFLQCTFENCNLGMLKFNHVGFDNVLFVGSKMIGVDFMHAKDFLFSVNFTNCILDYAAFTKKKNRKAHYLNCSLKGADFSEADLTSVHFERCDLSTAVFMGTTLSGANFTSSFNFTIDPERNSLRKAKFSPEGLAGLLTNYGIVVEQH